MTGISLISPDHSLPGDTTIVDDIFLNSQSACLRFTGTNVFSVVNKNIAYIIWIMDYLDSKIIQASLFVIPPNQTILIK